LKAAFAAQITELNTPMGPKDYREVIAPLHW